MSTAPRYERLGRITDFAAGLTPVLQLAAATGWDAVQLRSVLEPRLSLSSAVDYVERDLDQILGVVPMAQSRSACTSLRGVVQELERHRGAPADRSTLLLAAGSIVDAVGSLADRLAVELPVSLTSAPRIRIRTPS